MVDCEEARRLIEDEFDGTTEGADKRRFVRHLMECRRCRRYFAAFWAESENFRKALCDREAPSRLPANFADTVAALFDSVEFAPKSGAAWWTRRAAACVAAVLALVGVGFAMNAAGLLPIGKERVSQEAPAQEDSAPILEEQSSTLGERASPPALTEEQSSAAVEQSSTPVQTEEETLLLSGRDARSPSVPVLSASPALHASTAPRSVFDDAEMWWKFDSGGENGSVATLDQIHDARDATNAVPTAVPTALYGPQGGPTWTNVTVRLPNKGVMTSGTALFMPCERRVNGSKTQAYGSGANFGKVPVHSNDVTFVARVCLSGQEVSAKEQQLYNNAFAWGDSVGHMFGFSRYGTLYYPHLYSGKTPFGTAAADGGKLAMDAGVWYDVAYVQRTGADGNDTAMFVVSDAQRGFRIQTMVKPSTRIMGDGLTVYNSYIGRWNTGLAAKWTDYSEDLSKNTAGDFAFFSGAVHQMAIWGRALSLDEIREAFGERVGPENALADAASLWRFDEDPDGDGAFSLSDVRDVRRWRSPAPGDAALAAGGPNGGPVWTNMAVHLPAAGTTVTNDCLYFEVATNVYENAAGDEIHAAFPTCMTLGRPALAGSMTIVARIYPLRNIGANAGAYSFFYNNGLVWSSWSGSEFGLQSLEDPTGNTFLPAACIAHSWYKATSLAMRTNTWYDIAFVVNDNGTGEDGAALDDTLLVAVCDAEHGIRTQTLNISTNAYSLYAEYGTSVVVGSHSSAVTGMTEYWNATTGKQVGNDARSAKAFNGMIHKLAVWPRALSLDEIAQAFGNPLALFSVGMADGSGAEFADPGEGASDVSATAPWHDIAGVLDAGNPSLTIHFDAPSWNAGLSYAFRVVTAAERGVDRGAKSMVSLSVNGMAMGAKEVAAGDEQWWFVNKRAVAQGANTLRLALVGGASPVFIDKLEMSGSWQLGEQDGDQMFSRESLVGNVFYVGDGNLAHVARAVTSVRRTNQIRFYLPKFLAEKHPFDFSFGIYPSDGEGGCSMSVNGVEKSSRVGGLGPWRARTDFISTISFEPGELREGWNVIEPLWTGPNSWCEFNYYRLFIRDYKHGTMMFVR